MAVNVPIATLLLNISAQSSWKLPSFSSDLFLNLERDKKIPRRDEPGKKSQDLLKPQVSPEWILLARNGLFHRQLRANLHGVEPFAFPHMFHGFIDEISPNVSTRRREREMRREVSRDRQ